MERFILRMLLVFTAATIFGPLMLGCFWADLHKRSLINSYHCEWPFGDRDLGPLQCEPFEDWAKENSTTPRPQVKAKVQEQRL